MAWIQRRLDGTTRRVGAPWACAHGIQDVAPTGAKQPWLFGESYLLHSSCDTCILLPISADSLVLGPVGAAS